MPKNHETKPQSTIHGIARQQWQRGRGGGNSGAAGEVPGPNGSPPRDPARGKGVVAEEEEATEVPVEYREEDIAFRPAASAVTSSSHVPVTKYDIDEHLPDDLLARLLEENPEIGEIVLKAKEERARAIAASEAAERAEREQKDGEDLLREAEAEERAGAEAQRPRVTAVAKAGAMRWPDYAAETYTPPTPHLLIPSGFLAYTPQRSEYDDKTVLRDPQTHITNTWSEVPNEWVNKAIRRMLALENVVRRAASGFPLELRYPARSPPRGQRAAAKKLEEQEDTVTSTEETGSQDSRFTDRTTATGQEFAGSCCKEKASRQAMARAEEQFRIAMRKRPASEEQRAQKRPKLVLLPTFEDEEEDDGEDEERRKSTHPPAAIPMIPLMIQHTRKTPRRGLMTVITMVMTTVAILACKIGSEARIEVPSGAFYFLHFSFCFWGLRAQTKLNIPEELSASIIQNGNLNIVRLIELRERFGLPTFDSHNLQAYEYSWNNRELEEPLSDPITWLESRYVKWLHKEVKAKLGDTSESRWNQVCTRNKL
ncbi:hypothetical protein RHMOL_Rhmol09G0111200 [Rhododendron molle]|uniref:Uncharacterized protein n=1 Tax=Rhododendron molle TaxID=49168 RepID=A0ACC0MD93_RHOML|nr:hypothetical protein RHMOL_Rhmol09G0111200 [Rhododendron molle]